MSKVHGALIDQGTNFTQAIVHLPPVLSLAGDLPDGPVLPQPRRDPQRRPVRRLHPPEQLQHAAGLAPAGGLQDDPCRPLPERLRHPEPQPDRDSAGLGGLELHGGPDHLHLQQVDDERERPSVRGGRRRRVPDRLPRPPRLRGDRPGRRRPASVLPLAHVPRPAQRRPDRPGRPALAAHALPRPAPPQRVPQRAAAACGRTSARRTATPSPRSWPTGRRFTPEDVAAIQENYQQELESLLSVDDAVGRARGHPGGAPASWRTRDHLHLGQRLLPRGARGAGGEGAPV